jgi:hypothetical protein
MVVNFGSPQLSIFAIFFTAGGNTRRLTIELFRTGLNVTHPVEPLITRPTVDNLRNLFLTSMTEMLSGLQQPHTITLRILL